MDNLGKDLEVVFDEANDDARSSIETFGELIRESFEMLGHLNNETMKEQLKRTADTYEEVTRESVEKYFKGISESVKGTFQNMLKSAQNDDDQSGDQAVSEQEDEEDDYVLQKRQVDLNEDGVSTFQERMDALGDDLKIQFDGANAEAKTSLETFGDLISTAFKIIGHPKNETLKEEIKEKARIYRESTRKAAEGYYEGISDSFRETWKNIFDNPNKPADLDQRMQPVGQELKIIFDKGNKEARESVVAFGMLVKRTWLYICDIDNSTKKELMEKQADIYVNRTGDSVDFYWNGISKTFNDTFYNVFPGLTNITLDENAYEELSNYPVPPISSSAFSLFDASLWLTLAAIMFFTL